MADNANFTGALNAYTIGAKDVETARKYISYLHLHSMFGGHVGLHADIRNNEPNRSLDSTRGTYDMIDVYTIAGINVEAGTIVNFKIDDDNNVLGETYVYPATDSSRPLGCMATKASPSSQGVCVVNGVLEVPLNYMKGSSESEIERKDFVEYDIDAGAFNFSDSGYPVYNVYQDVDGDWIAIILFGNSISVSGGTDSDWEYDGSFKVSKGSGHSSDPFRTFYVTCNGGDVVVNGNHFTCPPLLYVEGADGYVPVGASTVASGEDLIMYEDWQDNVALSTGESLWLEVELCGDTVGFTYEDYDYSDIPIDGDTVFYVKLAEHNNDVDNPGVRQIQYGDIYYNFTRVKSAHENVHITPESGIGNIEISVDMPDIINDYYGPFKATIHAHQGLSIEGFTVDGYSGTFVRNPLDDGYDITYDGITTNFYQWSSFDDGVSFWTRTLDVQVGIPLYDLDGGGVVTPQNKTVETIYEAGAFDVIIKDSADRRELNPDTGDVEDLAGCVVLGNGSYINVFGATVNCDLAADIYLVGSTSGFSFVVADSYEDLTSYPLAVYVASVGGAVGESGLPRIEQELYGDVVVASLGGGSSNQDLTLSVSGNTASIGITGSTAHINLIGSTATGIFIQPGEDEDEFIIGSTASGGGFEYFGGFAVLPVSGSTTTVKVCDSTNPSGSIAGIVSIGGHTYSANTATITMGTNTSLYFEAWYTNSIGANNVLFTIGTNDAIVYQYTTSPNTSKAREWNKRLAYKDASGNIKQVHLTDNLEIVGRWS